MRILELIAAINFPILLGYFFKQVKIFKPEEIPALRKFVIKVTVPFIIFRNLYKADMESIKQLYPAVSSLIILTVFAVISSLIISSFFVKDKKKQNAFVLATYVGNYSYLGWGVIYHFYGEAGLLRAVFFTMFFWPVFLSSGFFLTWLKNRHNSESPSHKDLLKLIVKNAGPPVGSVVLAISMNLLSVPIHPVLMESIEKFAALTIPIILFSIGLSFSFKMSKQQLSIVLSGAAMRLVFMIIPGIITVLIIRNIFYMDLISQKIVILEAVMPTATLSPFFLDYIKSDREIHSGILTFSTIISLITIPLWYVVIEHSSFWIW